MPRRMTFAAILVCLSSSFPMSAQEVRLKAFVDSTRYRIGEWIDLKIHAEMSDAVTSISPMIGDTLGPFEILLVVASTSPGTVREPQVWTFRLITFEPGDNVQIPPLEFQYSLTTDPGSPRRAFTSPVPLRIEGVEIDPAGDIKDIKPPLSPPWRFEDVVSYLVLLAIVAVLGVGYYFLRKRKGAKTATKEIRPAIPPHQLALSALRDLEDKRLWQQGKIKEYYSEATEIVRRFFEGRLGIVALEMTSEEILRQLQSVEETKPLWKEINSFFLTADLVKFATYRPTPEENESELRWAYEVVRSLVPRPPVPEPQILEETNVR